VKARARATAADIYARVCKRVSMRNRASFRHSVRAVLTPAGGMVIVEV
jgi:hypothetical protein